MKQMLSPVKGILPFYSKSQRFLVGLYGADNSAMNAFYKATMLLRCLFVFNRV
jgi:hypothetical protein